MTDRTPTTEAGRHPTTANGAFLSAGLQALGFDEESADQQVADVEAEARAPLVAALQLIKAGGDEWSVRTATEALSREARP